MKKIAIIGSGMGGLSAGIYAQLNNFETTIFETHNIPGGQCTSWKRKGYTFDGCIHHFGAGESRTHFEKFWNELGVLPCEMVKTNEIISSVDSEGNYFHDYVDLNKLETHMKNIAPEDSALIDEYIKRIKSFMKNDAFGALSLGNFWDKIRNLPGFLALIKHFKYSLGTFGKRFSNEHLKKSLPLLHSSLPDFPLFLHLVKHAYMLKGDLAWPKGGAITVAKNMEKKYKELGGEIKYGKAVTKILTEGNKVCGVKLQDDTCHYADIVISNADGRKTINDMLSGQFTNKKINQLCRVDQDEEIPFSIMLFLGVKRDLSSYPSALLMFLKEEQIIAGHNTDHVDMQIYGYDKSMAPAGKGVIKVELFSKASYFLPFIKDKKAYKKEKDRLAKQIIELLEQQFPNLKDDVEVFDLCTIHSWERYMGGTQGYNNYPKHNDSVASMVLGLNQRFTLPRLKNFYFTGTWVTAAGALLMNAQSGKKVIQKICKKNNRRFHV